MGAIFKYYLYNGDENKLDNYHHKEQRDQCEQYGNDTYAGHLGAIPAGINYVKDEHFCSASAACKYVEENHNKWSCAMAVAYTHYEEVHHKPILKRMCKVEKEITKLETDLLLQIRNTKSKKIGCKKCGSSVNRQFLTSVNCPVCGKSESFYSTTQLKRLNCKREMLNQIKRTPFDTIKSQLNCYVVGGWCPS